MSDNKKYYYLKLKDNFFDSEEMKIVKAMDNGYEYACILLEMYLKSLKNDGKLIFQDTIPYNPKMLSIVLGHNIAIIEKAIKIFDELNLIELLESGEIFILNIQCYIGKSSTEADRIKTYRKSIEDKKLLQLSENTEGVQMYDKCTPKKEIEIKKEKEIEKEIEIEIKKEKTFSSDSDEYRLSTFLWEYIKNNNEQAKEPNMQKWSKVFDLILRLDKKTIDDIKKLIIFSQKHEFWYKIILSPGKLRQHYETLILQMKEPKYVSNKNKSNFVENCMTRDYDYDLLEKKLLGWAN
ncbi:phage replisome organizer N-terminal domain-containing protein [Clostridium bowmanii]|uniref:phage replisome organizer N-terminal domain-containing protein n=1 Tax=Clostridium bowmanii TaxID=132925 RepID=UPI001C0AC14B|nr:phage replisome organizer N-terminal domain-containing protein [Clostridium bowmanii]MBU3188724.1 phage replisome organizer N-terminal domain-containing protein [Clostridium bowmanii]MCA1073309.1 phage replisome organizer N-terminal domain-containing protein [Clostridium bowmanii]